MTTRTDLDSRATRPTGIIQIGRFGGVIVDGEPVFCTSCGHRDGYVPTQMPPGVIYLCGDCEAKFGVPVEMMSIPDPDGFRKG